jgi:hypothetical protein
MKRYYYIAVAVFFISGFCQAQGTDKIYNTGKVKVESIKDYDWFKKGYSDYQPDTAVVKGIENNMGSYSILVFGGTWCSDTKDLLPKFYKTTDASNISQERIILYLLNDRKKSTDRMEKKYRVNAVPVFIVLKDGMEIGRIVESVDKSIEEDLLKLIK